MTLAELKKRIIRWANDRDGDEVYPADAAKKFKVPKAQAIKAFLALHKSGDLVCADGCEKCDNL